MEDHGSSPRPNSSKSLLRPYAKNVEQICKMRLVGRKLVNSKTDLATSSEGPTPFPLEEKSYQNQASLLSILPDPKED